MYHALQLPSYQHSPEPPSANHFPSHLRVLCYCITVICQAVQKTRLLHYFLNFPLSRNEENLGSVIRQPA